MRAAFGRLLEVLWWCRWACGGGSGGGAAPSLLVLGVSCCAAFAGWRLGTSEPSPLNLDLPFQASGSDAAEEEAPEIVVFLGSVYETDSVVFCLDSSLSMTEGEWEVLLRQMERTVASFSERLHFGWVSFHDRITLHPPDRKPVAATETAKRVAMERLRQVKPGSWTCVLEGMLEAVHMAQRADPARKAVILLSDGKPACPGHDFVTYREEIFSSLRGDAARGVTIHTIGIGSDIDEDFLGRLAREHGGTFRRALR